MSPELKIEMRKLFCGTLTNNVVSLDCNHVSRTAEEFYTVRCQVSEMRNLYQRYVKLQKMIKMTKHSTPYKTAARQRLGRGKRQNWKKGQPNCQNYLMNHLPRNVYYTSLKRQLVLLPRIHQHVTKFCSHFNIRQDRKKASLLFYGIIFKALDTYIHSTIFSRLIFYSFFFLNCYILLEKRHFLPF